MPTDTLTVHIYNGGVANQFVYYEDDGKSFNYEHADYLKRTISFNPAKKTITLGEAIGSFKSKFHFVRFVMHGFNSLAQVNIKGKPMRVNSINYSMMPKAGNINPQGGNAGVAAGPKVYELNVPINNSNQIINY